MASSRDGVELALRRDARCMRRAAVCMVKVCSMAHHRLDALIASISPPSAPSSYLAIPQLFDDAAYLTGTGIGIVQSLRSMDLPEEPERGFAASLELDWGIVMHADGSRAMVATSWTALDQHDSQVPYIWRQGQCEQSQHFNRHSRANLSLSDTCSVTLHSHQFHHHQDCPPTDFGSSNINCIRQGNSRR
jgi:hypothetical protein